MFAVVGAFVCAVVDVGCVDDVGRAFVVAGGAALFAWPFFTIGLSGRRGWIVEMISSSSARVKESNWDRIGMARTLCWAGECIPSIESVVGIMVVVYLDEVRNGFRGVTF